VPVINKKKVASKVASAQLVLQDAPAKCAMRPGRRSGARGDKRKVSYPARDFYGQS
jgi:hypothetical protein